MTDTLVFDLHGVPPSRTLQSGRGAFVAGGRVHFFTRGPARVEAAQMREAFAVRLPPGWTPRTGPVEVEVLLVYPARKRDKVQPDTLLPHDCRPDVDNLTKSILDALTAVGVWRDDGQVYRLAVSKFRAAVPRWQVRVTFEGPAAKPPTPAKLQQGTLW